LAVVGESYHAFRLQATRSDFWLPCAVILVVEFIVIDEIYENNEDVYLEEENTAPNEHPSVLSIQAEYQSIYDEIVQPDQVIIVPGYFMRYIPLLGLELAWFYSGFRQTA
jgi:hypothetical protein